MNFLCTVHLRKPVVFDLIEILTLRKGIGEQIIQVKEKAPILEVSTFMNPAFSDHFTVMPMGSFERLTIVLEFTQRSRERLNCNSTKYNHD